MRKLQSLLLFISVLTFLSCSKDDPTDTDTGNEAILKIDVSYSGDVTSFDETLTLQVVSTKASSIKIVGHELGKEQPSNDVVWFTKIGTDLLPQTIYATSDKASAITISGVLTPVEITAGKNLTATIKFYSADKLIETKTVTAVSTESTTFTYPFTAK